MDKYSKTEEEEKLLWKEAILIFDTSSLLNFYEYSEKTIKDIVNGIFSEFKHRLWLPFNVKYEYSNNRHKPINSAIQKYDDLRNNLTNISNNFKQIENQIKSTEKHPVVDKELVSNYKQELDFFKDKFEKNISEKINELNKYREQDTIQNIILDWFEFGEAFKFSEIIELIKEGEFRYRNSIPPGYKDEKDKIGFQKYGDLIIWKQILKHANDTKKPIILVVDDFKEDWWILDKKKKPVSPRPELIDEIEEFTNVSFWMYSTQEFIEKSKTFFNPEFKDESIEEIKNVYISKFNKYVAGILISANREDEEPWRLERLRKVVNFIKKNSEVINLKELHDHKGMLTVKWTEEPNEADKSLLSLAWYQEKELWENVSHEIE